MSASLPPRHSEPVMVIMWERKFYAPYYSEMSSDYRDRLCIMDDQPHSDFTPRQRHTLKEFAASSNPLTAASTC